LLKCPCICTFLKVPNLGTTLSSSFFIPLTCCIMFPYLFVNFIKHICMHTHTEFGSEGKGFIANSA
jgi:hypothetical protein